ncbi:tetratricopeptide repeat protein [Kribbella sp. NPDC023972]|uniref:tetratricopeptide repeat protein n=1 Tax=Kribbella sp. NPDC023972 TaxID=3154795 RepID=UPI0033FB31F3
MGATEGRGLKVTENDVSLQDLIRIRQAGDFVGRAEPLRLFEQNLALPLDDPRRRFIFTLYGDAGIGKTSLVRQWQRVARSRDYVTGYVDEAALDVPSAIDLLARSLADCDAECPNFTGKLTQYHKHRHAVDSAPDAPSGISSLLTRSAVRIGLRAAEEIPLVGALTGEIDKDEAALQADQARAFLARRFAKHQDVELLLSPVDVLTAAFVTDLQAIGKRRPIALFVDTFERTGRFLNDWLLELLAGRHGNLPPNIILAISGQRPLDANLWADYLGIRTDVGLEVFTAAEARQLLATRGIDDNPTVDVILELSGCLPVLVATLAESSATHGTAELGDPSETAVDRFLKWEPDRKRRATALSGALPRRLDREVLAVTGGTDDDFDWLRRLPFVVSQTDGYRYHDVVRTPMLRSIRREAPNDWTTRHHALTAYYRTRREELDLQDRNGWKDSRWRDLKLEEEYHKLCAVGTPSLPSALFGLIDGYGRTSDTAAKWAQMITQAGQDAGLPDVQSRGEQLTTWLQGGPTDELLLLSSLAGDPSLDDAHRAAALAERSQVHERLGDYAAALKDLDKADSLRPDVHWIIGWRGGVHYEMRNYDQALADLDRAIELDPGYEWAISTRSGVHQDLRQYDAALEDINRAVEIDPADAWYLTGRGSIHHELGRYADALADYDRALELKPGDAWFLTSRAAVLQDLKKYPEALADLGRALEVDPQYTWALAERANLYRMLKRYPEALADVDRALENDPRYTWALTVRAMIHTATDDLPRALADLSSLLADDPDNPYLLGRRGDVYRLAERFDEALHDLDRAVELDPDDAWTLGTRGQVHQALGRSTEALADLDRAIELEPTAGWTLVHRAQLRQDAGRLDEAAADLDRAIELDPSSALALATRGAVHHDSGDLGRALADFDQAVGLDPGYAYPLARRAEIHSLDGRYTQALADLDRAIESVPDYAWAIAQRAILHERLGDHTAARLDHDRAVELDPQNTWIRGIRAEFFRRIGRYQAAIADFSGIIEEEPDDPWPWIGRGETYQAMGDDQAAFADFERVGEIDPGDDWCLYRRALTFLRQGQAAEAESLLRTAISRVDGYPVDISRRPRDAFNRAVYLTALGEQDAAREQFGNLLAAGPLAELVREAIGDLTELSTAIGPERVADVRSLLTDYWATLEH